MSNKTYITDDHNLNDSSIAASSKAVKDAFDQCLKLSGGTMQGVLSIGEFNNILVYNNDTTNGYKYIVLQSDEWGSGSRIQMMRGDSPNDPGVLVLVSGGTDFRIKPDGKAYVDGNAVATFNSSGQLAFPDGSTMWIA